MVFGHYVNYMHVQFMAYLIYVQRVSKNRREENDFFLKVHLV